MGSGYRVGDRHHYFRPVDIGIAQPRPAVMPHSRMPETIISSAPDWVVFCPRCGSAMETRVVIDKPRRVCPACGYIHFTDPKVGVGILVTDDEGRVLLVRRGVEPEKGKWSLPAGYLDQGEDPKETAVREVREECGLTVSIERLLDVFHNPPGQGASIFILYEGALRPAADYRPEMTRPMRLSSLWMICPDWLSPVPITP
ncbi:MAG: NUDIX hydrolase [Chloroflexota bacterium]